MGAWAVVLCPRLGIGLASAALARLFRDPPGLSRLTPGGRASALRDGPLAATVVKASGVRPAECEAMKDFRSTD